MNDQQIEAEIQAKGLTAPRLTPGDIEAEIKSCYFFTAGQGSVASAIPEDFAALDHVTICTLILNNGTKVVGVNTGPISPENFDAELARKLARAAAIDQVWPMMGFRFRDHLAAMSQGANRIAGIQPPADNDHVASGCTLFASTWTWDQFVQYGLKQCRESGNIIARDMAWSFRFHGLAVTHENDRCYLIGPTSLRFTPDDVLVIDDSGTLLVRPA